ncbi:MAG: M56 family metallopeptidase [Bacteroidales bacterium]|nr:M56 family metallopeptidase [Bacteroidales bacterium]MDT8372481.1 M56 family metallopeptidase [Bacteroidales bacterium]
MVESSICLTLLWVFYLVFLRNDTLHGRNRWFLIASMIFSAVVPLLELRISVNGAVMPPGGMASLLLPGTVVTQSSASGYTPSLIVLLPVMYIAGLAVSVALLTAFPLWLVKLSLSGKREGKIIRVPSQDHMCFSAFGHIFISSSVPADRAQRMISHEMKHISLGHHRDLLLAGLITALQWFNPAAYLVSRSLRALHEYEADSRCITEGEDIHSYQELILASVFRTPVTLFSNSFSKYSHLKTRFTMMTKKRTGGFSSLKVAVALPLALILLFVFSCKERSGAKTEAAPAVTEIEAPAEVFTDVEEMPVFQDDTTHHAFMNWVSANLRYPEEAAKQGIQGRVMVQFIIDEQGNVTEPKVVQGADPLLDQGQPLI